MSASTTVAKATPRPTILKAEMPKRADVSATSSAVNWTGCPEAWSKKSEGSQNAVLLIGAVVAVVLGAVGAARHTELVHHDLGLPGRGESAENHRVFVDVVGEHDPVIGAG